MLHENDIYLARLFKNVYLPSSRSASYDPNCCSHFKEEMKVPTNKRSACINTKISLWRTYFSHLSSLRNKWFNKKNNQTRLLCWLITSSRKAFSILNDSQRELSLRRSILDVGCFSALSATSMSSNKKILNKGNFGLTYEQHFKYQERS